MGGNTEKIISSLNLENWLWDTVVKWDNNRSRFFNNLFKQEIKSVLISHKIMTENDEVTEMYAELYLKLTPSNKQTRCSLLERKPVRGKCIKKNESSRKKTISIRMDKWLWDISGKVEPNRSLFFKKLLLIKIKKELVKEGIVEEKTLFEKESSELYLIQQVQKMLNINNIAR